MSESEFYQALSSGLCIQVGYNHTQWYNLDNPEAKWRPTTRYRLKP